jgi:hypothetical protein
MTRPVWPWGRGIQATLLAGFDKVSLSFEERYIEDEMSYGRFGPASLKIRKMPDWMHENDLNVNYYTVLVETRIVNLVLEPLLGVFLLLCFYSESCHLGRGYHRFSGAPPIPLES